MSISDQSAANPSKITQFTRQIRLAPQFVNRMCARLETAEARAAGVAGLLYGARLGTLIVVQAFRSLIESEVAVIETDQKSLDDTVRELARGAQDDAAVAPLDLVGWYSFRAFPGFKDRDAEFHERLFRSNSDIALLMRRGDGAFLLFDFYARTEEGLLSARQHFTGDARFSPAQRTTAIVDIRLQNRTNPVFVVAAAAGTGSASVQSLETERVAAAPLTAIECPQILQTQMRAAATPPVPRLCL